MRTTLTIDQIIQEWISELSINKDSSRTYFVMLKNFYNWCSVNQKEKRSLKTSDVIEYRQYILSKYSNKYASTILTVLKIYYKWIDEKGYWSNIASPIKLPRQNHEFLKDPLTETEVLKLLSIFPRYTQKGRRDYLITILMLIRGLRCVEVSRMDLSDIITKRGKTCIQIQRKGHNDKDDFISVQDIINELNSHLNDIKNKDEDQPLFRNYSKNQNGHRLDPHSIGKIITAYFNQAGIKSKRVTPHSLRHTAAVTLIRNHESIDDIQLFLGHSKSEITKIYTAYANNEIKLEGKQGIILKDHFLTPIKI